MTPKSCWRRRCWAQSPGSVTAVGRRRRHGESPPGGKATTGTSRLAAGSPLCVVAGRRNRRGAASPGGRAAAGQSSRAVELPSGGAAAGRCVGRAPSGAERAPSGRQAGAGVDGQRSRRRTALPCGREAPGVTVEVARSAFAVVAQLSRVPGVAYRVLVFLGAFVDRSTACRLEARAAEVRDCVAREDRLARHCGMLLSGSC